MCTLSAILRTKESPYYYHYINEDFESIFFLASCSNWRHLTIYKHTDGMFAMTHFGANIETFLCQLFQYSQHFIVVRRYVEPRKSCWQAFNAVCHNRLCVGRAWIMFCRKSFNFIVVTTYACSFHAYRSLKIKTCYHKYCYYLCLFNFNEAIKTGGKVEFGF